jgi:hypothetical protein
VTAEAHEFFSTEDGRLAMSEAEGWVVTTITDLAGEVGEQARMALSELLLSMQQLAARLETLGGAKRPVEVLLGFTSEGDQLYAAVTEHEMAFVEIAPDGVGRRLLCGPYSVDEAHSMVNAVVKASAG